MPLKDLDKLTVVKLRAELIARGLDSKGNKPFLVDRLRIALEQEERDGTAPPDLKMFATDNNQLEDAASNDQDTANEMEEQGASAAADQSISFNPGEISKGSNGTASLGKPHFSQDLFFLSQFLSTPHVSLTWSFVTDC